MQKRGSKQSSYQTEKTVEGQRNSHHEFRLYTHVPGYVQFSLNGCKKLFLEIQRSYQDVKNIANRLPQNMQINGALQQICMHMRASALIASSVRFQSGVGDTSPVLQLPFPVDTGVVEEPIV